MKPENNSENQYKENKDYLVAAVAAFISVVGIVTLIAVGLLIMYAFSRP